MPGMSSHAVPEVTTGYKRGPESSRFSWDKSLGYKIRSVLPGMEVLSNNINSEGNMKHLITRLKRFQDITTTSHLWYRPDRSDAEVVGRVYTTQCYLSNSSNPHQRCIGCDVEYHANQDTSFHTTLLGAFSQYDSSCTDSRP